MSKVQCIPFHEFRKSDGFAWAGDVTHIDIPSDGMDAPRRSTLVLLENGRPLGPAHAIHDDIRAMGAGRFSHWDGRLWFSTSDNTDPRQNGRHYELAIVSPDVSPCPEVDADSLDLEAAYRTFREHDLLIIRHLLPPARMAYFRDVIVGLYAEQDRLFEAGQIGDSRSYKTGFLFGKDLERATGGAFSLYDIASSPVLQAFLGHVFRRENCAAWRYFGSQLRRVSGPPQPWSIHTRWHNDQYGVVDDGLLLIVNSPLMPMGIDAPGLAFVKAARDEVKQYIKWDSHQEYRVDEGGQSTRIDGNAFDPEAIARTFDPRIVRPVINPGDVAIFSGWTMHSAYVYPHMAGWRIGVETRFKEQRAPRDGRRAEALRHIRRQG